jgi:hypothetical protein
LEPERLGEVAESKLVAIDVAVGTTLAASLENDCGSYMHEILLRD